MEKFSAFVSSIDWIFAVVTLIGGRYWGNKYFTLSKNSALNFLFFATAFGIIWVAIQHFTVGIKKEQISDLFITYLFTTSFYELLAKQFLTWLEGFFPKKNKEGQ